MYLFFCSVPSALRVFEVGVIASQVAYCENQLAFECESWPINVTVVHWAFDFNISCCKVNNGNHFFFFSLEKGDCDRVCVCVCEEVQHGWEKLQHSGLRAYLQLLSKTIQHNQVPEKYQIIVSVSNSLLPFRELHSLQLPLVSSWTLCFKVTLYQIILPLLCCFFFPSTWHT